MELLEKIRKANGAAAMKSRKLHRDAVKLQYVNVPSLKLLTSMHLSDDYDFDDDGSELARSVPVRVSSRKNKSFPAKSTHDAISIASEGMIIFIMNCSCYTYLCFHLNFIYLCMYKKTFAAINTALESSLACQNRVTVVTWYHLLRR